MWAAPTASGFFRSPVARSRRLPEMQRRGEAALAKAGHQAILRHPMTDQDTPEADDPKPFVLMTKDQWDRMDKLTGGELNRWVGTMNKRIDDHRLARLPILKYKPTPWQRIKLWLFRLLP